MNTFSPAVMEHVELSLQKSVFDLGKLVHRNDDIIITIIVKMATAELSLNLWEDLA